MKFIAAVMVLGGLLGCKPPPGSVDESKITLTAAEAAYVASTLEIKWAVEDNRPPYIFIEDGAVKGLSFEYLQLIAKKTGLRFKPVRTGTFLKSVIALDQGLVDVVTAVRPTVELSEFMQFTLPIVNRRGVFVFRTNAGAPRSPFTVGLRLGYDNSLKAYLTNRFPDMKFVETEDDEQSLVLLQKGLVDGSLMDESTANYWIDKATLNAQKAPINFDYPYAFGYQKDNVLLGSILSKALDSISAEDRKTLNNKWLTK
jgi:ABC-type amino acid transport substrate-binding protein